MIRLIPDADRQIKKNVFEKSVRAYYYSVCEHYSRGHVNAFISDMQILITKLGIMVASVSQGAKTRISYCAGSIKYLCETVLESPQMSATFKSIGLNAKGNKQKHDIATDVNIDMTRCVAAYNSLITGIANKYGLRSLENMIVRKSDNDRPAPKNPNAGRAPAPIPQNKKSPSPNKTGRPAESGATADDNLKVKATLEKGDGRYTKGLFNKKEMVNFKLRISIENYEGLRISSIVATIKGKDDKLEKKLSTALKSTTEFDLPTRSYGGHIEASVVVVYKIGLFKSKQIKITVSKNF